MHRIRSNLSFAALLAASVIGCRGEATAQPGNPLQAAGAQAISPQIAQTQSADTMESCDDLPLTEKEACYARQAQDLVAECERMRLHHCAPYAKVHESEKQLEQLNADLLQTVRKAYASYESSQPGYVKDVEQFLGNTDRTWRAYRDTNCNLEPLIQGMSRSEAADLTEACRAEKTAERVTELRNMVSTLKKKTE